MSQKTTKILYRITTGLLTALMLMSATMYLAQYEMVSEVFGKLGFPTFIIYPLAVAKYLGLIAIWSNISPKLKEWAYAGFFFDIVLAIGAHININDGEALPAGIGLLLVLSSYYFNSQLKKEEAKNEVPVA
ncbi:DoxX family protein [Flammeovirga aprica]|uniref:DoxX family protein n=1 Tax=Flammeovirga aprica JL-4 TaxID=694437 RepID=A0A7X9P2A2_9BACT|nr:DoxX family protein [Flammeovirga aprica]NME68095.1 DoxX family protein [Flammeovirga aprica JL-4]